MSLLSQFFGGSGSSNKVECELLVVGGGGSSGSGGAGEGSGGGGGGDVLHYFNAKLDKGVTYTIAIGGSSSSTSVTYSSGSIIAGGGGNGGNGNNGDAGIGDIGSLLTLGSGGGGGASISAPPNQFTGYKSGSTPHLSYDEILDSLVKCGGNPGSDASDLNPAAVDTSGGGGGAGEAANYDNGGRGLSISITGSSVEYGGGGDGERVLPGSTGSGSAGAANTGEGGEGSRGPAANGGSGIVVFAYKNTYAAATVTGTYTEPSRSGYRVYRFTGSGTITFN